MFFRHTIYDWCLLLSFNSFLLSFPPNLSKDKGLLIWALVYHTHKGTSFKELVDYVQFISRLRLLVNCDSISVSSQFLFFRVVSFCNSRIMDIRMSFGVGRLSTFSRKRTLYVTCLNIISTLIMSSFVFLLRLSGSLWKSTASTVSSMSKSRLSKLASSFRRTADDNLHWCIMCTVCSGISPQLTHLSSPPLPRLSFTLVHSVLISTCREVHLREGRSSDL